MKMKLLIIGLIILAFIYVALSATMTIEVPDQDVPRITEAYGSIYNLGRPATPAEVQLMIQRWLRDSTQDYERRKNTYQYTPPPLHFSPTPTPTATPTPTP